MIETHLYGKLRRFSQATDARSNSVLAIPHEAGDTVSTVIARIGIPIKELGSNIFLDGRYASLDSAVSDGARLGLFPHDMQLLYKWYFAPSTGSAAPKPDDKTSDSASGSRTGEGVRK